MFEWLLLMIAGILEIGWAISMKASAGFTRLVPSLVFLLLAALSFAALSVAVRRLPLGTAYAIWTGIGALGTVLVGIFYWGESYDLKRLFFLSLIVIGITGLKFFHQANG